MLPQVTGYEIIEEIGRGGMATVYKAMQPSLKRYVALKVLPPYFAHDEDFVARFKHEALAVAKLRHPNIVQVYDFHEEGDCLYLAMEYVPGGSVKDKFSKEKPLNLKLAVKLIIEVAQALHHAHEKGFIHRDIKPSNILLGEEQQAIISDFGIVKALEGTSLTRNASINIIGTSEYMSPEQAQGAVVDRRSDIYSLGVVFYEMLTGLPPFISESPVSILHQHIYEPPRPIREINKLVPEELELVILKLLNKNPEFRFPDCLSLVKTLSQIKVVDGAEEKQLAGHSFGLPKPTLLKAKPVAPLTNQKKQKASATRIKVKSKAATSLRLPYYLFLFFFAALAFSVLLFYKSYTLPTFIYQFKPWQQQTARVKRELTWFQNQAKLSVNLNVTNNNNKPLRLVLREILPPSLSLKQLKFSQKPQLIGRVAIWHLIIKPKKSVSLYYYSSLKSLTKKQFIFLAQSYQLPKPVALIVQPNELVLEDGKQKKLKAWLKMNDLSLKKLSQVKTQLANPNFAKVKNLTVIAQKPGRTTLTVQVQKWRLQIPVIISPVPVSLIITPQEIGTMPAGQSVQLQTELLYSDGGHKTVNSKWLLNKGTGVELTKDGFVKSLTPGTVEIKATYLKFVAFKQITFTESLPQLLAQPKQAAVKKRVLPAPASRQSQGEIVPLPPLVGTGL